MLRCETWMLFFLMISGTIHQIFTCSEHALRQALFENYDKLLRPVKDQSTITVLQVYTKIYNIISMNEQEESIDLVIWTTLKWQDEFLEWNPTDFDNCTLFYIPASEVWQPDYAILNILNSVPIISDDVLYVWIHNNGTVTMYHSYYSTLRCPMDIAAFPFDTQICLIVGSIWAYDSTHINLTLADGGSNFDDTQKDSPEFEIVSFEAQKILIYNSANTKAVPQLHYELKLRRLPDYYIFVLIVPSFLLTSLCIIGIFTPNSNAGDRNEKMTLGLTTLLSMAVILNITADSMPKSSTGLPLLGYYVLYEIGMCALATILSTAIIFIHERATTQDWDPPNFIFWIATFKTPGAYFKRAKTSFEVKKNSFPLRQQNQPEGNQQNQFIAVSSSTIASQNSTINNHEVIADLQHIITTIDSHLKMLKSDAENRKIWIMALDRIDLVLLVLLLISNCTLTAITLF